MRWIIVATVVTVLGTSCTSSTEMTSAASSGVRSPARAPSPEPSVDAVVRFHGSVNPLRGHTRRHVLSANWHPGCPVPPSELRVVRVTYLSFVGDVRHGPLVVRRQVAHDVLWVFRQLFRTGFPIHRIGLSPRPQPIDWNSTRNLTSSFNCRAATGNPGSLSQHSFGWAVDINPLQNPYVRLDGSVLRAAAKRYVDRSRHTPGMIHPGDIVVRSFAKIGWEWGGDWHTLKDYMHFSLTGR